MAPSTFCLFVEKSDLCRCVDNSEKERVCDSKRESARNSKREKHQERQSEYVYLCMKTHEEVEIDKSKTDTVKRGPLQGDLKQAASRSILLQICRIEGISDQN